MRRNLIFIIITVLVLTGMVQCTRENTMGEKEGKMVIYQVLPRLFGNNVSTNKAWGTIEENGVGKFSDFNLDALKEIRALGATHIWYTGVLHHCVIRDYSQYGISQDDPDVVKGRAGSPYAIKDYYNVNPDLADDPAKRLEEFESLIRRTHLAGLKVIIDIVPNHVARNYQSVLNQDGSSDFGAEDDPSNEYKRNNNFYYIPGQAFEVPDFEPGFEPLGGEDHPLRDGIFKEFPAKWSGNGARSTKPSQHDWYETVKVNFGITPDGRKDFPLLPEEYGQRSIEDHFKFWQGKDIPDSWKKFERIAHYWLDKGIDGFRYDMAQMVPVEFWSYLNSSIKMKNADAVLISEIYIPEIYREYINKGKMDYLYDKVDMYDTLKNIMQGKGSTDNLPALLLRLSDIQSHMLHFLENHDEHRIASPEFAGNASKGKPAMVVSATVGTAPIMIYFGQEVGEEGKGDAGYGKTGRTTIYDYWGVPAHQRWMNNGAFDGGLLSGDESELREFYAGLLNYSSKSTALQGDYREIHTFNRENTPGYSDRIFSFLRWNNNKHVLVICNFDDRNIFEFDLKIPMDLANELGLKPGTTRFTDALGSTKRFDLNVNDTSACSLIRIDPLESFVLEF